MTSEAALQRPIGWWLKEADTCLDGAFDRALEDRDVDRRGWQVLTSLAKQPTARTDLCASLASFDPPAAVEAVVDDLTARGWVEESAGLLRLTRDGEREQAASAPLVGGVREQVTAALSQDDYVTLVGLLERLVAALR